MQAGPVDGDLLGQASRDDLVPQPLCRLRELPLPVGRTRQPGEQHFGVGGDDAPRSARWLRAADAVRNAGLQHVAISELGDRPADPRRE
jgi:hypothetical protein